jgi:phage shock protein A
MEEFSFSLMVQIITFMVSVAAAAIWLRSALVKQRHEELEQLADTRGKRVEDLENKVGELRGEVENLKGQMQALRDLKAVEIAREVVAQLNQRDIDLFD